MKKLNKYFLLTIVILVLGCSPQRRISNIYDKHPDLKPVESTITIIETRDSIVYKDSIVKIKIPADTVWEEGEIIYIPGDSEPFQIRPKQLKAETNYAISTAWIEGTILKLQLRDKDTTLYFQLDSVKMEAYHWKDMYEHKTTVVKERYVPKFTRFMAWVGILLVVGGIAIGVLKTWFKGILPF